MDFDAGVVRCGTFRYFRCPGCGSLNLALGENIAFESIYTDDGYFDEHYGSYFETLPTQAANFRMYLRKLQPCLHPDMRIAEIGCGAGAFLNVLRHAGYEHVSGFEMNPKAVAFCRSRGLDVHKMAAFDPVKERWDAVCLFDVIEHVDRPDEFISGIHAVLRPGGLLVVSTATTDSPAARILGSHWWFLNPPDHCLIYSRQALKMTFLRNGLNLVRDIPVWMHWVDLRNVFTKLGRMFPHLDSLQSPSFRFAIPILHFSDRMMVFRKPVGLT